MKKIVSALIIIALMVIPSSCVADTNYEFLYSTKRGVLYNVTTSDGWKCIYNETEHTMRVVEYTGKDKSITIPESIDGIETYVDGLALHSGITKVNFSEYFSYFDKYTFENLLSIGKGCEIVIENGIADIALSAADCLKAGIVLCGYDGSTTQKFAQTNGIPFKSLGTSKEAVKVNVLPTLTWDITKSVWEGGEILCDFDLDAGDSRITAYAISFKRADDHSIGGYVVHKTIPSATFISESLVIRTGQDSILYDIDGMELKTKITSGEYLVQFYIQTDTGAAFATEQIKMVEVKDCSHGIDGKGTRFVINESCLWICDGYNYITNYDDSDGAKIWGFYGKSEIESKYRVNNSSICPSHIILLTDIDAKAFAKLYSSKCHDKAIESVFDFLRDMLLDKAVDAAEVDEVYGEAAKMYIKATCGDYEVSEFIEEFVKDKLIDIFHGKVAKLSLETVKEAAEQAAFVYNQDLADTYYRFAETGYGLTIVWGYDTDKKEHVCKVFTDNPLSPYKKWISGSETECFITPIQKGSKDSRLTGYITTAPTRLIEAIDESFDYLCDWQFR